MENLRIPTSVEICAGAGGQARGLGLAGFHHQALVEIDTWACKTLGKAFPGVPLFEQDVRIFLDAVKKDPSPYRNLDVLAGGVPCPPFSLAGKQLGQDDERDLFPVMLDLVAALKPKAVMIENVRGLMLDKFRPYRELISARLAELEYEVVQWDVFQAEKFGVAQLRPRSILVALRRELAGHYEQLDPSVSQAPMVTVGEALRESMELRGMSPENAEAWAANAKSVAPTLVGGSKKHGGADLGPSRAKRQWEQMGVDAWGLADDDDDVEPVIPRKHEKPRVDGPRLTVAQAAVLQGFPANWPFQGGKTARYRQVGNAFPPPVAQAVASQILSALQKAEPEAPWLSPDAEGEQPAVPGQRQQSRSSKPRGSRAPKTEEQSTLQP